MLARFRARRATLLGAFAFTLFTIFAINFSATGGSDDPTQASSSYSWSSLSAYLPSVSDGEDSTLRPDCAVASKYG